ncbi:MAG: EamA family transporter [Victivallales bacterium]|nr:EamA family transporter [Victivallales bacterium]
MSLCSTSTKGILLTLLAGTLWGLISLFVRKLSALGLSSIDITALRSFFAGLVLLASVPLIDMNALKVKARDIWCLAGCGIVSISLFNICYFAAIQLTTVNISVVLLYTSPIFITLFSCIFFGERFTRWKLLSLVMVMLGCILGSGMLSDGEMRLSPLGLLLGLASGLFYGLYSIFGRFAQQRGYSSLSITLWSFIFSGAASMLFLNYTRVMHVLTNPQSWLALAGLVLFATILPYCAYTAGLRLLPPSVAAITVAVEPVVGTLVGTLFFREPLPIAAIIGMILIIAAMPVTRIVHGHGPCTQNASQIDNQIEDLKE